MRLPPQKTTRVHFSALPFGEVPAFLSRLRSRETISRLALEFLVLTAARSGEVRGVRWDEIDLAARLWSIPAERMKAGRAHVVPLSSAALDCLARAARYRREDLPLVFPGRQRGQPLSDMALTRLLREMGETVTAHGFRSSFRDWVAERTHFAPEVAEMALAHAIASQTEAAYRRGNLLKKRRECMEAWGVYCTTVPVTAPASWPAASAVHSPPSDAAGRAEGGGQIPCGPLPQGPFP